MMLEYRVLLWRLKLLNISFISPSSFDRDAARCRALIPRIPITSFRYVIFIPYLSSFYSHVSGA